MGLADIQETPRAPDTSPLQFKSGPIIGYAALAVLAIALIASHWDVWAVDFSALYYAGQFFAAGDLGEVYAAPPHVIGHQMPDAWAAAAEASGFGDEQTYPFIYPPWVAVVMAPVPGLVGPQAGMNLFLIVNVAMIVVGIWLAWRIMAPTGVAFWVWAIISAAFMISSVPSLMALMLGQAQILVFFLCLLAFERYRAGHMATAGVLLALAACLKITPAAFAVVFLFDRNWRALAGFVLAGAAMLLASFAAAGIELHLTYLNRLRTISGNIYTIFFAWSFETFLHEIWNAAQGTAPLHEQTEFHFAKPGWIGAISKAFLLISFSLAWRVTRRLTGPQRLSFQVLIVALIVPLFAPLGWAHYYLFAIFLLPGVLGFLTGKQALVVLGIAGGILNVHFQKIFWAFDFYVFPQILFTVPMFFALLAFVLSRAAVVSSRSRSAGILQPQPAE